MDMVESECRVKVEQRRFVAVGSMHGGGDFVMTKRETLQLRHAVPDDTNTRRWWASLVNAAWRTSDVPWEGARRELVAHGQMISSVPSPPPQHQHRRMGNTAAPARDESGDTCVICLSTVTERAITSPCNHYTFDFVCLVSWLQERSTCPLCRYSR